MAILAIAATATVAAAAGTLDEPLDRYVRRPAEQQDPAYVPTRCAGLYVGIIGFAGKSLEPPLLDSMEENSASLAIAAMEVRAKQKGGQPPDYANIIFAEVKAFSYLYESRMKKNQDATGQAFMGDETIKSDITLCKAAVSMLPPQ